MSTPMTPEYEAEIRDHVATMSNYSLGNLFARDLLAELDRVRAALSDAADQVAERDDELGNVHAELDRVRAELAALPAPVVETAWCDALGNVWPVGHFPAATEALVLKTNPTVQRTVRISEWTEVTAKPADVLSEAADFYQPGHTYTNAEHPEYGWKFRCDTVTTHPEDGERTALGWRFFNGKWDAYTYGETDWDVARYYGTATTGGAS
ncbi:hypothetical protein [Streptomyces sp. NPDC005969]|uniref:hypothetical protein n=1 Tax=Streptomyces sp. NPDC005969 TaxID=3156722 RepID=UPI0033CAE539